MQEVIKSILDMTKERLKSPFFGTFILSWSIINWRPIFYIILSDQPIEFKIKIIDSEFNNINNTFIFLFLLAFIYLILPGYIMLLVDKINTLSYGQRKSIKFGLILKELKLKVDIAREENTLKSLKENPDLHSENENLKSQNEKQQNEIKALVKQIHNDIKAPTIFEKASNQIRMQNDFLIRELQNNNLIIDFLHFYEHIKDKNYIPLDSFDNLKYEKILDFVLSKGIMRKMGEKDGVSAHYEITGIGNNIYNEIKKSVNGIF